LAGAACGWRHLDDGFNPKRTLENARTLVEQRGALSLFGTVGTGQTMAVLPYIAEKRVPLIAAYSGSPALRTQPNPYFFHHPGGLRRRAGAHRAQPGGHAGQT
jgi:ABC-type branched-subunit amino acid transport system substrate-binding protein